MIIEQILSFSIGALWGLAISSLILTLIDRKLQKQQQKQQTKEGEIKFGMESKKWAVEDILTGLH